ncbi:tripartite tricarboxylate transporter substrate binding protein [Bordetella sp. N]|uniref:Bug family tripartite tricarboxylate transporter substrate binding protein n=1 Tax=Bordetella sp. N TaxID=1746199 RepID=UPI0018D25ADC|nr:tripartite tricarboxylate transporter substrate binding protein [Bordetella sp. N]
MTRRQMLGLMTASGIAALPLRSRAAYPERPVTVVVPYSAGGPASLLARYIAAEVQQSTGKPLVVENKPGAGLNVGAQAVANSAPDGYTLLINASSMYVPTHFGGRTPQDNLRDFAPITIVGSFPLLLVCNSDLPVKNVPELIAYAKSHPGQVAYGSSGNGSLTHMGGAMFAHMAGVDMLHVPYRGISEAMVDISAGRVQLAFGGIPTTLPLVKNGKLRPLALTSAQRSAAAPELPTVAEGGLPGYEVNPWYGAVAPAKTPPAIVDQIHAQLAGVMQSPRVQAQWKEWGADPSYSKTPADFRALMQREADKWAALVAAAGIKLE